jgi:hypothetical protein
VIPNAMPYMHYKNDEPQAQHLSPLSCSPPHPSDQTHGGFYNVISGTPSSFGGTASKAYLKVRWCSTAIAVFYATIYRSGNDNLIVLWIERKTSYLSFVILVKFRCDGSYFFNPVHTHENK